MRYQGRIVRWNDDKGFGFIAPNGGGEDAFVHIKAFSRRGRRPIDGEIVTYVLSTDAKGRARAESVAFVDERKALAPAERGRGLIWLAIAFIAFIGGSAWLGKMPGWVLALYVGASLLAFVVYARDKSAARNDGWRTRESTLHFIALLGGWPGALLAQRLLRHKSSKTSFQSVFWLTIFLNCGGLIWLLSGKGGVVMRSVLAI